MPTVQTTNQKFTISSVSYGTLTLVAATGSDIKNLYPGLIGNLNSSTGTPGVIQVIIKAVESSGVITCIPYPSLAARDLALYNAGSVFFDSQLIEGLDPVSSAQLPLATALVPGAESPFNYSKLTALPSNQELRTIVLARAPYCVSGDETTTTTVGSTASGSTTAMLASVGTFSAGQGIFITGAGAGGVDYLGIVSDVVGSAVHFSPATGTTVAAGTVVQHDSTAGIQAVHDTITPASAGQGVRLLFPPGGVLCNGPLQDTGNTNCVIKLPTIPMTLVPMDGPPVVIVWEGALPTASVSHSAPTLPNGGGTVIKCNRTTAGNFLNGNCLTSSFGQFTNVFIWIDNLTFRAPDDPAFTVLALRQCMNAKIGTRGDVTIDTGRSQVVSPREISSPTHAGGVALSMPGSSCAAINTIGHLSVCGFYKGLYVNGDHCHVENAYFAFCLYSMDISVNYGFTANRIVIDNTYSGLSGTCGATGFVNIATLTVAQGQFVINDYDNLLRGYVGLYYDSGCTTPVNGGHNLTVRDLRTGTLTVNDATQLMVLGRKIVDNVAFTSVASVATPAGAHDPVTTDAFVLSSAKRYKGVVTITSKGGNALLELKPNGASTAKPSWFETLAGAFTQPANLCYLGHSVDGGNPTVEFEISPMTGGVCIVRWTTIYANTGVSGTNMAQGVGSITSDFSALTIDFGTTASGAWSLTEYSM